MAKGKRDRLAADELGALKGTILTPGLPYQWVMAYGWVIVGFYVCHVSPVRIRLAHANYYIRAGKSHAELAREGPGGETDWRYYGDLEVTVGHNLFTTPYEGEVPRGPVRLR